MTEPVQGGSRVQLLQELRRQGINDECVLAAMAETPRDRFVPDEQREHAWANVALPIGSGQTISQPYIVALMTQALQLTGNERILEIGTGSGYQAAILSQLAGSVISVERHAPLAAAATRLLSDLGITNVSIQIGDGTLGWPAGAPYDGILVTAGAPRVPDHLEEQLRPDGGRLVIPIGDLNDQQLIAYERVGGRLTEQTLGPVRFVPLVGSLAWGTSAEHERQS
ncbi:MAG: protein-L-isoaspartate(D-aspartate) O-methyltransferase [Thermomicrobiales bacterium]|nr:protein-L-isoaspartate(D-aspartate) O-methyltransferase [Thermomicrobiales bacterium]